MSLMTGNIYLYILVMAAVTYLVRVLPLVLIRGEIQSVLIRSFLYYMPYVTLTVMVFPAVFSTTASLVSAALGTAVAVFLAWRGKNLIVISLAACVAVFLCELLI